jgi:hypothetical protein
MRNVGGKAGGFINKKFFHPSSLRNQAVPVPQMFFCAELCNVFWQMNLNERCLFFLGSILDPL